MSKTVKALEMFIFRNRWLQASLCMAMALIRSGKH